MRKHTIRFGVHAGQHLVFESEKEFREYFPNAVDYRDENLSYFNPKVFWHDWYHVEIGDWVVADDGYIIQVLDKRELKNRRNQITRTFRFCIGTYYTWIRKNGSLGVKNFYASYMTKHKPANASMRNKAPRDKKLLAMLKAGADPLTAYNEIYVGRNKPAKLQYSAANTIISRMFEDHGEEIVNSLVKLVNKVNQEIRDKMGEEPADLLAKSIAKDFEQIYKLQSVTGIKDKIAFYKFFMAINLPKANGVKQIGDSEYEEVAPPLLKQGEEDEDS